MVKVQNMPFKTVSLWSCYPLCSWSKDNFLKWCSFSKSGEAHQGISRGLWPENVMQAPVDDAYSHKSVDILSATAHLH